MSEVDKYPNSPDSADKGGDEMVIHVNPEHRELLKSVIAKLTEEKAEGYTAEEVVRRAVETETRGKIVRPTELEHKEKRYLEELLWLREHPEEWNVARTFEDQITERAKRTGKSLPKVRSGWWVRREGVED